MRAILSEKTLIFMLFETNRFFFGSFDELKKYQLCQLVTIRMSKHMLSKSAKVLEEWLQYLLLRLEKN